MFEKTENKRKRGRVWPIFEKIRVYIEYVIETAEHNNEISVGALRPNAMEDSLMQLLKAVWVTTLIIE